MRRERQTTRLTWHLCCSACRKAWLSGPVRLGGMLPGKPPWEARLPKVGDPTRDASDMMEAQEFQRRWASLPSGSRGARLLAYGKPPRP